MTPTTTTHCHPQNQVPDVMASSSSPLQKPTQDPPPHHHHPLKCPRCDSSNTKFCYYNNYSLSQPRHFCKACKRYWTRGGTLRNVPVGGGCRKNKRPKRQTSSGGGGGGDGASSSANAQPQIDLTSPAANRMQNPLFYNPIELNFPFSSYSSARVSSSEFDLQSQMNGLGLGFSSGINDYKNAYKPIQDLITNSAPSSPFTAAGNSNSIFFGSSGFAASSAMASLLASSVNHDGKSVMQYHDPQMPGANTGKDVKQERENGSVWNPNPNQNQNQNHNQNQIEQINSSDPSSFLWNTTNLSAWFDPSSMGSSVPSLI